jgi:hypothetical protein
VHLDRLFCALLVLSMGALGCDDDETTDGTPGGPGGTGGAGGADPGPPPTSPKALVKLKTALRYRADVARSLDIPEAEVCNELGRLDCTTLHQVVMGDADPYLSALYEPLPATSATSPLAYERVANSACIRRVDADLAGAEPFIFKGLEVSGGAFLDPASPALAESIRELYRRALSREATDREVATLTGSYAAVAAADPETPARSWALASCVAVMTSLENVFY